MKMHLLGKTGVKVSQLCFGTLTFGGRDGFKRFGDFGQKEANTLVDMALEAGINFFDTADVYAQGKSEKIV